MYDFNRTRVFSRYCHFRGIWFKVFYKPAKKSWHFFLVPTTLPGEQWREGNHSGSRYWEGETLRNQSSIDEDGMEERIFDLCFLLGSLFDCCMMLICRMAFECTTTDGWIE